jgi:hypothetical protein
VACACACALVLGAVPAGAGGGWVPARGATYVEASLLYAQTPDRYAADGSRVPFRRLGDVDRSTTYRDLALVLFAERGLGKGFGLEGDVAFKRVDIEEPATLFRSSGPADLRLQLKRGFRVGAAALAVSAESRFALGYDETTYPALGSGEVDAAIQAHAGLSRGSGWIQAEGGMRWRGGPPGDEWPFALQGGVHVSERWAAQLDLRGHGERGPRAGGADPEFDPALVGSRILMAGPGATYAANRWLRISAQAWRSWSGANVPAGWKWKLAVARVG